MVIWIQPAVIFLCDLIFSVGFAEGLAMIVRSVDKSAHHKRLGLSAAFKVGLGWCGCP